MIGKGLKWERHALCRHYALSSLMTYGIAGERDALASAQPSPLSTTTSGMAPKRKATRQPTMERPRTRAQVQRRGPSSPQRDTRESSALSTPPRDEPEPEPHREKMDTDDSPTGELHESQQQSGSETGRQIRMRNVPEDADEETSSDDYIEPHQQPSIRAVSTTTSLCWNYFNRVDLAERQTR
jgi:hypothetical protein